MAKVFEFPYRTVAEISLPRLVKNLSTLRTISGREVIPVVKADAYGHGLIAVSQALVSRGSVEALAVATLEEATEIRKHIRRPIDILVLSGFLPHHFEAYDHLRLTPVIHSLHHLRSLQGRDRLPPIHLKIDTGMHRLGIQPSELTDAIRVLEKLPTKLSGLMTHFAESENLASSFIDHQMTVFEDACRELISRRLLETDARIHTGNTGAVLHGKCGLSNAVRPGLGIYGVSPNPRLEKSSALVPVLQWKTRVLALKDLQSKDTVGYGRTYKAKRRERIATIPIGYADGYPRLLSTAGQVIIRGKRVSICGRISMDLTAVHSPKTMSIREGTLVTLIGNDEKESLSAWDLAQWAHTIPYEILCGISQRVPRIYLE